MGKTLSRSGAAIARAGRLNLGETAGARKKKTRGWWDDMFPEQKTQGAMISKKVVGLVRQSGSLD